MGDTAFRRGPRYEAIRAWYARRAEREGCQAVVGHRQRCKRELVLWDSFCGLYLCEQHRDAIEQQQLHRCGYGRRKGGAR